VREKSGKHEPIHGLLYALRQDVIRSTVAEFVHIAKQIVHAFQFFKASPIVDGNLAQNTTRRIKYKTVDTWECHWLVWIVISSQALFLHHLCFVEIQTLLRDIQFHQSSMPRFVILNGIQFLFVQTINISNVLGVLSSSRQ
jgi:hypothetical protein